MCAGQYFHVCPYVGLCERLDGCVCDRVCLCVTVCMCECDSGLCLCMNVHERKRGSGFKVNMLK